MMRVYSYSIMGMLLALTACFQHNTEHSIEPVTSYTTYAKGFTVEKHRGYTIVSVRNPWDSTALLQQYILVGKGNSLPDSLPKGTVVRTPLDGVAVFNALHCSLIDRLNQSESVSAVCESRYIHIDTIQTRLSQGIIADLGESFQPNIEKLIAVHPEAIILSAMRDANYGGIDRLGIPIITCTEYLENTPLGQAEWIRFLALFFEEESLADSLFQESCARYGEISSRVKQTEHRPTVFTELKMGSAWYVAGGNSFIAHLLADAGADYIWREEPSTGALPLSFEKVYEKACNADFWLFKYYQEENFGYSMLRQQYEPYKNFRAFKEGRIFGCNTATAPYYEELPLYPERVLADFVAIFHPECMPHHTLRYYHTLER